MSRRVVEEIEFARKRPRLEKLAESRTVSKLTELIGRGSLSVAGACDLARAVVEDHELPAGAIKTFASLGSSGKHPQNCERDLHRWLRGLYGLVLEPYVIQVKLQIDGFRSKPVSIRVLLPHEILHALEPRSSLTQLCLATLAVMSGWVFGSMYSHCLLGRTIQLSTMKVWT